MSERGVCVVTHPLSSSGENATRTLLNILSALGPVSLVTADLPNNSTIRDDHEVVEVTQAGVGGSIPVAAARFLLNQLRMSRVLVSRDEDVVLFFGATAYLLPVLVAQLAGKTVAVEPRGDVPLTLKLAWRQRIPTPLADALATLVRLLERVNFIAADGVVTYTPNMARQLDLNPNAPNVYPHGARYVDTEKFRPRTSFTERPKTIGFLGRIDEEKGIRTLAEVARRIPNEYTFRFIGTGNLEGWLREELADEIAAGDVEVTGWVDHNNVPAELNRLRLLVMPSEPTEGLPTTILESLASGTPVYATPVAGVPDVVHEGETGFLMEETDPEGIATTLERILTRNDLDNVAANGRTLIESRYSFDAAVERYRDILAALRA
ncbi:glycosyltransferase family 4 protein [Halobacterium sp. KA-4]|uniref:glycosyltransferase family 4 protein n=1 Tax=Halobacterium sp. KA-4 TaxID=2896367 RepID=UPI001E3C0570|nr:glycosyltransferase family 4 protein [Halobacterium sp. KA-4]MCD2200489.1 glycosyltransferase family 4 protein [Halobacterium sp. KA-4]